MRFPRRPTLEYFVIDMLDNADRAGAHLESVARALTAALQVGRFDAGRLLDMAAEYGTRRTQEVVRSSLPDNPHAAA